MTPEDRNEFVKDLADLINRHSIENLKQYSGYHFWQSILNDTQRIKNQIKETEQEIQFRQFMLRMQKGNLRAVEVLNEVKNKLK